MSFASKLHKAATFFGLVVFVFANTGNVSAQEFSEAHLEAARKAILVTGSTSRYDQILPSVADQLKANQISNQPDQEELITQIVDNAAIELASRRGDLESEAALIYARSFTEEELNAISEFFSTEVGAKFLAQTPVLVRRLEEASRVWGTGIGRDLSQAVAKKMEEAGIR